MKRSASIIFSGWFLTLGFSPAPGQSALLSRTHLQTVRSLRWQGVVRQQYDYSCGTGSIANLLALYGDKSIDEKELLDHYTALRSRKAVEAAIREGFSLLDLKRMLLMLGYESEGVRFEPGTLPDELKPMIVYLVVKGYRHFAVFAGVDRGQIVLLDPARGKIRIGLPRFLSEWDGSALILHDTPRPDAFLLGTGQLTEAQEASRSAVLAH